MYIRTKHEARSMNTNTSGMMDLGIHTYSVLTPYRCDIYWRLDQSSNNPIHMCIPLVHTSSQDIRSTTIGCAQEIGASQAALEHGEDVHVHVRREKQKIACSASWLPYLGSMMSGHKNGKWRTSRLSMQFDCSSGGGFLRHQQNWQDAGWLGCTMTKNEVEYCLRLG